MFLIVKSCQELEEPHTEEVIWMAGYSSRIPQPLTGQLKVDVVLVQTRNRTKETVRLLDQKT